jgi:hypothetical protein
MRKRSFASRGSRFQVPSLLAPSSELPLAPEGTPESHPKLGTRDQKPLTQQLRQLLSEIGIVPYGISVVGSDLQFLAVVASEPEEKRLWTRVLHD